MRKRGDLLTKRKMGGNEGHEGVSRVLHNLIERSNERDGEEVLFTSEAASS